MGNDYSHAYLVFSYGADLISGKSISFEGKITGVTDLGSIVRLTVEAGKKFSVQITKKSLIEMNLNVGSEVYLTFKASAVHLI